MSTFTLCTKCGRKRMRGGSTNPSGLCRLCFHEAKRAEAAAIWACSKCGAQRSRGGGTRKEGGLCRTCYRGSVKRQHPSTRQRGPYKPRGEQPRGKPARVEVIPADTAPAWWTVAPREGWGDLVKHMAPKIQPIKISEPNRELFEGSL